MQTGFGSRCDPVITPEVSPLTPRDDHFLLKANLSQQPPTDDDDIMTECFSLLYLSHLLTVPVPSQNEKQKTKTELNNNNNDKKNDDKNRLCHKFEFSTHSKGP